ncbi:MAG: HAD family hydrolase [Tannerella sp.]|jgi:putative hydrolase of the HAD superfamily|nr:HAD family hydrolase [Tannerella sp.]
MIDTGRIRGVIFDYGGTIDSNGVHWAEVIRQAYQSVNVPVTKEEFRAAYIHGERTLGKNPIIKPHHTFLDMLQLKIDIQMESLPGSFNFDVSMKHQIAHFCYGYARTSIAKARLVIEWMSGMYPLALVSNFYGNIAAVLSDFGIDHFFPVIIESAVVGVRKPDPQIFRLGVEALGMKADEVVVIGDSYDKDIVPAQTAGCQTIWLKNTGWSEYTGNETADLIISDFAELRQL